MKKKNYVLWFWRIVYPLLSYLGISVFVQIPFAFLYSASSMIEANGDLVKMQELMVEKLLAATLPIMLLSMVLTFPLCFFLMRADRKKKQKLEGKYIYEKTTPVQFILTALLAVAFCVGVNNLITFSHIIDLFPGYKDVAASIYGGGIIMELLVVGIGAPVIEELLFRGLAYSRIREYCRPGLAMVLSGLLFGIYHMNMVQGIYATLLGIVLAYVYEKFHTIAAPIIFHAAANIMSVLITEIAVIGGLFENVVSAVLITIISLIVLVLILLKFRKTTQSFTVELPQQREDLTVPEE